MTDTFLVAVSVLPFGYELHLEVWLLVGVILGLGFYIAKILAPKIHKVSAQKTGAGKIPVSRPPAITSRQKWAFFGAIATILFASSWPIHDISESYLYSVHMVQHLSITFFAPPLILIAMPEWFARLIAGYKSPAGEGGTTPPWLKRLAHPVTAGLLFNALVAISHVPAVVNASVDSSVFHYFIHMAIFTTGMIMWLPVCGPYRELRLKLPGQMAYLFTMSLLPTIPAAFLTFANGPIYASYTGEFRLWNISAVVDQQAAGLIMKLVGGFFLWGIIGYIFFKWSQANEKEQEKERLVKELKRAEEKSSLKTYN